MTMAKRVFKKEVGSWPKIYDLGNNAYEVVARHKDPRRIEWMTRLSKVPGIIVALWLFPKMNSDNAALIIFGVFASWMILLILTRSILTDIRFLTSTTTRVRFQNGQIRWGRYAIDADEPRQFRSHRHRMAAREIREENPTNKVPLRYWQFSTEVFIDTGEGWMHPNLVAEVASDEFEEWGHRLSSTLRFVDRQWRAGAERSTKETTRVDLD